MKFVAIDSSLAHTGVAIGNVGPTGLITVDKILLSSTEKSKHKQVRASSDTIVRCRKTHRFLKQIIKDVKPAFVFIETPSGSQSSAGMKSYGATCMLIAAISPPPIEVTPTEVKMASFGTKTASKDDMIQWAFSKYPSLEWLYYKEKLQNKNEHMADAIAIAYAAVKTDEFVRLQAIYKQ